MQNIIFVIQISTLYSQTDMGGGEAGRLLLSPLGVAAECDDDDENGSMSRSSDAKYQSRDSTMFTSVLQSTRL